MSARLINITSLFPRSGKTHFAASLARWMARHGHSVEVLHLGSPGLARVVASDGSIISRPAAVLAVAAMVESGIRHEDRTALETLAFASEFVIVESAGTDPILPESFDLRLARDGDTYRLEGYGRLPQWNGPAIVPDVPVDLAQMTPWQIGGWPRVGVVSLPHLSNFSDFQILRGAEWIVTPAVGKFAILFLPATSDPVSDRRWLDEQGLSPWFESQVSEGCQLVSVGWPFRNARVIEPGDLSDPVLASRIVDRRLDPPLPSEETMDRLSAWLGSWTRWSSLFERLHSGVVK